MEGILIIIFTVVMVWCFDNPVLDSTVGDILSDNMLSDKATPGDPKHAKDLQQGQGGADQLMVPQQSQMVSPMAANPFPQPSVGISSQPSIGGDFPMSGAMMQQQQMPAQQPGGSLAGLKVGDFLGGICAVVLIICVGMCIFS